MDVSGERLLTPVGHLHGSPGAQGEHAGVDLDVEVLTRPERPAHACEMDPDLVLGESEARRDLQAIPVEPLGRHVELDPAVLGGHGEAPFRAERRLILRGRLVVPLDPDVRVDLGIACSILR